VAQPKQVEAPPSIVIITEPDNSDENDLKNHLRPSEIVKKLDDYVVGQNDAKRAVAIALRNRWRRRNLPDDIRKEIMPKNVLLVGPTGKLNFWNDVLFILLALEVAFILSHLTHQIHDCYCYHYCYYYCCFFFSNCRMW